MVTKKRYRVLRIGILAVFAIFKDVSQWGNNFASMGFNRTVGWISETHPSFLATTLVDALWLIHPTAATAISITTMLMEY
ncbi:hypothetical protein DJ030_04560 [bacterium endosymbiont of Escarpia laminata]|nr:MAG: hypothetical protein DJ030_04560 [bacterium endosymbiont of Escarpia laminata]